MASKVNRIRNDITFSFCIYLLSGTVLFDKNMDLGGVVRLDIVPVDELDEGFLELRHPNLEEEGVVEIVLVKSVNLIEINPQPPPVRALDLLYDIYRCL